ncbi:MAG: hypothetical protein PHO08_10900 [Methylococcales bacterium]|nr:hypothetical protein [Methylococcales bacterium]
MINRKNASGNFQPHSRILISIPCLPMFGLLLAIAFCIPACTPAKPVDETEYSAKIVGNWLGTVGDMKESVTFSADGSFIAQVRPEGFISNTLSQGVTGTIRGTWAINAKTITLKIISAEDERVINSVTSSTIMAFTPNELSMKSDRGETSTFERAEPL